MDRVNLTEDVQTSSVFAGQSGCCCMGNPLATHRREPYQNALCHNTHIICYTLQELSGYATAGVKLQTSHTSSVFRLEETVGAVDTICVPVLVCIRVACSPPNLNLSVYSRTRVHGCLSVCQQQCPCLKQKSPLVHVEKRGLKEERTWILSFSGLTLARPPLANSRQQIRSRELPTGLVTGA